MRSIRWAALCFFAVTMPALADFEGVLEMKMTMKHGTNGTGKTYVSKAGWRTEMEMQMPGTPRAGAGGPMKVTVLGKANEPDKIYNLDDERRIYTVTDVNKAREVAGKREEETYTVRKLGPDSVAGFACEKVILTSSKGSAFEACAAEEALGSSSWLTAMQQRGRAGAAGGWVRALKEAGLGQFLVRLVMHDKATGEESVRMELVRVEKKSLPSSMFEIPPGYREGSN